MRLRLLVIGLLVAGCSPVTKRDGGMTRTVLDSMKPKPISSTSSGPATEGGVTSATLAAPQDPDTPSSQTIERSDVRSAVLPVVTERVTVTETPDGTKTTVTEKAVPTPVTLSKTEQKVSTAIGTTHVNLSANTSAKLDSMKPVQYLGIACVIASLAMFNSIVFTALGRNRLLQAACGVGGVVMIMLPVMIVGNETYLLYGGIGLVGLLVLWYFFHEQGRRQGFIDANNDGLDDRTGKPKNGQDQPQS